MAPPHNRSISLIATHCPLGPTDGWLSGVHATGPVVPPVVVRTVVVVVPSPMTAVVVLAVVVEDWVMVA